MYRSGRMGSCKNKRNFRSLSISKNSGNADDSTGSMDETLLWLYDDSGIENSAANAKGSQANREKILCVKTKRRGDPCFRRGETKKMEGSHSIIRSVIGVRISASRFGVGTASCYVRRGKAIGSKRNSLHCDRNCLSESASFDFIGTEKSTIK